MKTDITAYSASEIIEELRAGRLTHTAVYDAVEARVAAVNPNINALITPCFDRARDQLATNPNIAQRPLAGLPVIVKDLTEVQGVRCTHGSQIFANHFPTANDLLVDQLEQMGAVVIGKSNTSEFGAGANTFNELFGATINPYQPGLTAGGSSGGSAAAVATGMSWFATGTDLGGSLRIPAAFCGVFGLRPSAGLIPKGGQAPPALAPYDSRNHAGPLTRSLEDLRLLLPAMVPNQANLLSRRLKKSVAVLNNLTDVIPIAPENRDAVTRAAEQCEALGWVVERVDLDLTGLKDAFQCLRALDFVTAFAPLLERHRADLKPEIIWNIKQGQKLTASDIATARNCVRRWQWELLHLFSSYDAVITPVTAVRPFPVEQRYVEEIAGVKLDNYVDWLAPTFLFSLWTGPSLAVPMGLGGDSLPDSVQLIAAHNDELALLEVADAIASVPTPPI